MKTPMEPQLSDLCIELSFCVKSFLITNIIVVVGRIFEESENLKNMLQRLTPENDV